MAEPFALLVPELLKGSSALSLVQPSTSGPLACLKKSEVWAPVFDGVFSWRHNGSISIPN